MWSIVEFGKKKTVCTSNTIEKEKQVERQGERMETSDSKRDSLQQEDQHKQELECIIYLSFPVYFYYISCVFPLEKKESFPLQSLLYLSSFLLPRHQTVQERKTEAALYIPFVIL